MSRELDTAVAVTRDVFWVGRHDPETALHCNAYILIDEQDVVLIDPGSIPDFHVVMRKVLDVVDAGEVSWVIASHQDPDVCGNLAVVEEVLRTDVKVVATPNTIRLIRSLGVRSQFYDIEENGRRLVLASGREIEFIPTPYLHSPGAMITYDVKTRTAFTSDLFGGLSKRWELFAAEGFLDAMTAFHQLYMPSSALLAPCMDRLATRAKLDVLVSRRTEELERVRSRLEAEESERRRLQARLIQAERMQAIGALAGGVAHDLRNYLTVVSCCLDDLAPEASELLPDAKEATSQALRLTRQLTDLGRAPEPRPTGAPVNAVASRAVSLLAASLPDQIEMRLALDPSDPVARIDPDQVQQALFNLCINARDAVAPRGGFIALATGTQRVAEPPPYAQNASPGDYVWLRVTDNGPGIPAHVLPRIFEPFFTTKPLGAGTGLGLSQAYGCVSAHAGWIEVQSTEAGTSLQMFFPAQPTPQD